MGWLDRIKLGKELLGLVGTALDSARDLAHARELLSQAAQRGDLDGPLRTVLSAQARARTYERTGR